MRSMIPPEPTRIVEVPSGNVADDHCGCRARNSWHTVMLRHPISPIAELFGVAGQIERTGKRVCGVRPCENRTKIKNREQTFHIVVNIDPARLLLIRLMANK